MALTDLSTDGGTARVLNATSEVTVQELKARAARYAYVDFGKFNEAKADAEKRFALLTDYANAFQTLSDMFKSDDDSTVLSVAGTNGLSFICRTLSENMYDVIMDLPSSINNMSKAIRFDHATDRVNATD